MKITPGNYWIYESYYLDSNYNGAPGGNSGGPAVYDSVYALSDTTFNNKVFHRLSRPYEAGGESRETLLIYDSLDYAVCYGTHILFALSDSSTVFYARTYVQPQFSPDSTASVQYKRIREQTVTTPAGVYNTIAMGFTWTFHPYTIDHKPVSQRTQYHCYAKGIGMVSETLPFYAGDSHYIERRLVRYHVQ
jgi:hypothetical protein